MGQINKITYFIHTYKIIQNDENDKNERKRGNRNILPTQHTAQTETTSI